MRHPWSVLVLLAVVFAPGCGSIVAPGPDMVPINSEPQGARVLLDGVPIGRTPMTAAIPRDSEGVVRLELDGYMAMEEDLGKVLNGWFIPGNLLWILIWPAVPIAVVTDLVLSNQAKYSTTPLHFEMSRGSPSDVLQRDRAPTTRH